MCFSHERIIDRPFPCLLQAVIDQVRHDHSLLKERVARLGGPKATARLEAGLAAARAAALAQSSSAPGTPSTSPNSSPAKTSTSSGTVPNSPEAFPARTVAGAPVEGDENEGMAWELLYNLQWQLPTEELEAGWKDATGETAVMKVSSVHRLLLHVGYHLHCPLPLLHSMHDSYFRLLESSPGSQSRLQHSGGAYCIDTHALC